MLTPKFSAWRHGACAALALTLTLASTGVQAAPQPLDEAVVIVDEEVVLRSDLDRRMNTVKQDLAARKMRLPADEVLRKQVLDRLVNDAVQLQIARRAGVRISDQEMTQVLENVAKQNNLSVEQLRAQIEKDGVNFEIFRDDLRNEVMVSRIRDAQVRRRVFISEQEVDAMLETMNAAGAERSEYHLGHILISIGEQASTEQVQAASQKAQAIVERLRKGEDFGEIALAESSGQEALQGGDFGWKSLSQMPSLFATAVKNMKAAEISEPLRSASGLHILKVFDERGNDRMIVRQTHARHILVKPSTILSEADAEKRIKDLHARALKGEDFAAMAKKYSDDPGSANQGGDLGWANPGQFVPAFETAMGVLQPNEFSEPFRSQYGWHFLQVLDRRDNDQTAEAKKQQAYKILFNRKFDEEVESWIRELRDQAYIKYLDKDKKKS